MPGTDGVDLIISFGEVGGATLTMYFADGTPPLEVSGDKTIFADFLNDHEVSEMTGSGLRVAFIFWQQRSVVLSDHVINKLGAKVYLPAAVAAAPPTPVAAPVATPDELGDGSGTDMLATVPIGA
jgi:hypothetical protein